MGFHSGSVPRVLSLARISAGELVAYTYNMDYMTHECISGAAADDAAAEFVVGIPRLGASHHKFFDDLDACAATMFDDSDRIGAGIHLDIHGNAAEHMSLVHEVDDGHCVLTGSKIGDIHFSTHSPKPPTLSAATFVIDDPMKVPLKKNIDGPATATEVPVPADGCAVVVGSKKKKAPTGKCETGKLPAEGEKKRRCVKSTSCFRGVTHHCRTGRWESHVCTFREQREPTNPSAE